MLGVLEFVKLNPVDFVELASVSVCVLLLLLVFSAYYVGFLSASVFL